MLKVLQITDTHILPEADGTLLGVNTERYFKRVLQKAYEQHSAFDLILLTGDLVQDPSISGYQRILTTLQDYNTPSLCLPGNHDDAILMRKILNRNQVSSSKRWSLNNWQIICLDSQQPNSQGGFLSNQELDYLSRQLEQNQDLHTLVAVHHHCINSKSAWMDTMVIENSEELFKVIDQHPQIKAVTTGHIHQLLENKHNSVSIFGTPSTCFQFKPGCKEFALDNKSPGYRILDLYPEGNIKSKVYWLQEPLVGLDFSLHSY